MALAMTHEEAASYLAGSEIRSYRDLPRLIFHIQTKWRDDPRPRAGLIRVREFTMLDSYSMDSAAAGMEAQYEAHDQGLSSHVPALRAPGGRGRRRYRHDGWKDRARIHVPLGYRRGYDPALPGLRLQGQPPGGALPEERRGRRKDRCRSRRWRRRGSHRSTI